MQEKETKEKRTVSSKRNRAGFHDKKKEQGKTHKHSHTKCLVAPGFCGMRAETALPGKPAHCCRART